MTVTTTDEQLEIPPSTGAGTEPTDAAERSPDAAPPGTSPTADRSTTRRDRWGRLVDAGMSTAEYAVGTVAACAFAAVLFALVRSAEVREMLLSIIRRALDLTF